MIPEEQYKKLLDDAHRSDKWSIFIAQGLMEMIEEDILIPIEKGAYKNFKSVDASDHVAVVETQMQGKSVDFIRKKINEIINNGVYAKQVLKQEQLKTLPKEGENYG